MAGIKVSDISVTYRNGHTALYDASFTLPKGSITALVGVNGSGKSTLFKSIMGFVPVSQGSVEILGLPAKKRSSKMWWLMSHKVKKSTGIFPY